MLSRRIIVQGLTTLAAGFIWRPAWAVSGGHAASVPVAVSPEIAALADAWEAVGQEYDETKHSKFTRMVNRGESIDHACPDYRQWEDAKARLLQATSVLLKEPSKSEGDVILKYHVIDTHYSSRVVDYWTWDFGIKGWQLCEIVRCEASAFAVPINQFWGGGSMTSPWAMLDGDRDSPRWAVIARWRRRGMPQDIAAASERAHPL